MKLTRKRDPYGVEKLWLKGHGIDDPTEESLVHLRRRNRVALALFLIVAIAFFLSYFFMIRGGGR